jgi:DNA-binding PadR family transcriptional regulator
MANQANGLFQVLDDIKNFGLSQLGNLQGRATSFSPDDESLERAVLAALSTGPKNAHEIVNLIAAAAAGAWTPTDGQVSALLLQLVEAKTVAAGKKEDRKVYTLTKAGEARLEELSAKAGETSSSGDNASNDKARKPFEFPASFSDALGNLKLPIHCDQTLMDAARKLGPAVWDVAQTGSKEQQRAAAEALAQARAAILKILTEN